MLNYRSIEAAVEGVQPEVVVGCFKNAKQVVNKKALRSTLADSVEMLDVILSNIGLCTPKGKDSRLVTMPTLSNRKAGLLYLLRNSTGYTKGHCVYCKEIAEYVYGYTYVTSTVMYVQQRENGAIVEYKLVGHVEGIDFYKKVGYAFKASACTGSRDRGYKFAVLGGVTVPLHAFIYFTNNPQDILQYIIGTKCINHCVTEVVKTAKDGVVCYSVEKYEYDVDSLELISNSENVIHGFFVKNNGLDNTYLSAKDMSRYLVAKLYHGGLSNEEICALIYMGSTKEKFFKPELIESVKTYMSSTKVQNELVKGFERPNKQIYENILDTLM